MNKAEISEDIQQKIQKNRADWAASDAERDKGLAEPADVKAYKDISYGEYGEYSLLDVYVPAEKSETLLPVLINVHGGGYFYGSKDLYRFYAMDMVHDGFAVLNINYRLCPENKFPAPLEDINETMCWLEKHASEYNLDASRVFMMGDSAGAQLVSHYAAINSNEKFAALYNLKKHNLKLKGISLACGMYDLKEALHSGTDSALVYLGDFDSKDEQMLDVLGAVNSDYPPSFIFSCPNDFLFANLKPMADLINSRGGRAVSKIYGTAAMKDVAHVFHCNMRTEIGAQARRDQGKFLLGL